MEQSYISPEGIEKIKKELEELKFKKQEITKRIEEAKIQGDLSENAEYAEAKEAQSFNEGRIAKLEEILKNAKVITKSRNQTAVRVGSTVEVKSGGATKIFTITGSEEANPAENFISNESPLGQAFLNRSAGETVEVQTPKGAVKYKIIKIR